MDNKTSQKNHIANRLARLSAVQALYESSFEQGTPAEIVQRVIDKGFKELRDEDDGEVTITEKPDQELFGAIVKGVVVNKDDLDVMLLGALDTKKSWERIEKLLKTILRAGAFELHHHAQIPAGVIINDYIEVARAFYDAKEPGLVNAVLDKLSTRLRSDE